MSTLSKICFALFVSSVNSLQFLLNTNDPVCIQVTPQSNDIPISVQFGVTGVNEYNVMFTAVQMGQEIKRVINDGDVEVTLDQQKGMSPVELCWSKTDRKAKKVNFVVIQPTRDLQAKATLSTVEDLQGQIKDLKDKLKRISNNILKQRNVEEDHFETTDATARGQGWMSLIKFLTVMIICGAQVYFTTSFFKNKGGRRQGQAGMDLNPFGQTVI